MGEWESVERPALIGNDSPAPRVYRVMMLPLLLILGAVAPHSTPAGEAASDSIATVREALHRSGTPRAQGFRRSGKERGGGVAARRRAATKLTYTYRF